MRTKNKSLPAFKSKLYKKPLALAVAAALGTLPVHAAVTPGDKTWESTIVDSTPAENVIFRIPGSKVAIASDVDGDSLVAMDAEKYDTASSTVTEAGIYYRRFNADGSAAGDLELVGDLVALSDDININELDVAMDIDGDAIILWQQYNNTDTVGTLLAQRINANGELVGIPIEIAAGSTDNSQVAMDSDGNFIVVWNAVATDQNDVLFRRFKADGSALDATPVVANTVTADNQRNPSLAVGLDGDFILAWESYGQDGSTPDPTNGVYARRFDADGTPKDTAEFQVHQDVSEDEKEPQVVMDATGDFMIAWEKYDKYPNPTDIFQRYFSSDGNPKGDEVGIQQGSKLAGVAMDVDGDSIVSSLQYSKYAGDVESEGLIFKANESSPVAQLDSSCDTAACVITDIAVDADGDAIVTELSATYDPVTSFTSYLYKIIRYQGVEETDLAVTLQASAGSIETGGTVEFTGNVSNTHAVAGTTGMASVDQTIGAALGVAATFVLPTGGSLIDASGTDWTCDAAVEGRLTCRLDTILLAGTNSDVVIQWQAPDTETALAIGMQGEAQANDPDTSNNESIAAVSVQKPDEPDAPVTVQGGGDGGGAMGWFSLLLLPLFGLKRFQRKSNLL